ncbi:hypothetical protein I4U23_023666 [Adineta vaga]|nr:hypothetical protein I4U23_023666 [Adineta vaga]
MELSDSINPAVGIFHAACLENDLIEVKKTISPHVLDEPDSNGDTALHIVSSKGYIQLIQLLFHYNASRTIQNKNGLTAEEVALNDDTKNLFKLKKRPKSDSKHFIGSANEIEWLDTYRNAHRIAFENLEHMKRWVLKVPFTELLKKLREGYINHIKFRSDLSKKEIEGYLELVSDWEQPVGLITAYVSGGTGFCTALNYDLAKHGSNFRFLSIQNLFDSGYSDNEAPKRLGQYIFTALVINHSSFEKYQRTGLSYRGMSLTQSEIDQYKNGDIIMTRSFLSTSKTQQTADLFLSPSHEHKQDPSENKADEQKYPVLCVYDVVNSRSSLNLEPLSHFDEQEVLISPFVVFCVKKPADTSLYLDKPKDGVTLIHLKESNSNLK